VIKAVFFDLFETLITEWKDNQRKATYSVEELGLDEEVYKKEWSARREMRMDGTFPNHQSVLIDILTSQGKKVDKTVIDDIHQRRVNSKLVPFKEVNEEIQEVLKELRNMNIKVGLISNCAPEEVEGWNTSLLADLFDDVVFSFQVGKYKPNSEIYQRACENLNVSPINTLFIGDGGSNELYGASKVGMNTYHATWFQPPFISKKITGYPKLKSPNQIIGVIKRYEYTN
jgi:HAD superfamily hydrolase (TIGR01549 family)